MLLLTPYAVVHDFATTRYWLCDVAHDVYVFAPCGMMMCSMVYDGAHDGDISHDGV